jgi:hypothetical protein
MALKTLTWADFDKHQPCYSPLEKYGPFSGTMLDILKNPNIPINDKFWAFTRSNILPTYIHRQFACDCVRKTPLKDGRTVWDLLTDERSENAVIIAEKYITGAASGDELQAAHAAARDAVLACAQAAAWDAARAAQLNIAISILEAENLNP